MAKRRMFSLDVIDTDRFLDMGTTARLLYYELGMRADDDGFVASPKRIMRTVGCNQNDLDELIENGYVIQFQSGVIVISHWKLQNTIQSDRYNETIYTDEKSLLVEINKKYALKADVNNVETNCIQNDSELSDTTETQYSLDKNSIEQERIAQERKEKNKSNKENEGQEKEVRRKNPNSKQPLPSNATNEEIREYFNKLKSERM